MVPALTFGCSEHWRCARWMLAVYRHIPHLREAFGKTVRWLWVLAYLSAFSKIGSLFWYRRRHARCQDSTVQIFCARQTPTSATRLLAQGVTTFEFSRTLLSMKKRMWPSSQGPFSAICWYPLHGPAFCGCFGYAAYFTGVLCMFTPAVHP